MLCSVELLKTGVTSPISCKALSFLEEHYIQRERSNELVDASNYATLLRQCGSAKDLAGGRRLHACLARSGLGQDRLLRNLLIDMYGKCGSLENAQAVFDRLQRRNVFSWTLLIAAYAKNGQSRRAFQLLQEMELEGMKPDIVTFVSILDACASWRCIALGKIIHARMSNGGYEAGVVPGTALVNMYGKCGNLEDARRMFEGMGIKDTVSWSAMVAGYAQNGFGMDALTLAQQMQLEGIRPKRITFLSIIDACASLGAVKQGRLIHAQVIDAGLESDAVIGAALVHMYGKCKSLRDAIAVFDKIPRGDVISWTSMVTAFAQSDSGDRAALKLFQKMDLEGVKPDCISFTSILQACGSIPIACQMQMHERISQSGLDSDVVVGTALVNMYAKCGKLQLARSAFDRILRKNVVSWTAMVAAYAQSGHGTDSLRLFQQMQLEGVKPERITLVSAVDACASLAAMPRVKAVHAQIVEAGIDSDVVLGSALVNSYSNCASLGDAILAFQRIQQRNVISWNAMVAAYTQAGHGKQALRQMQMMDLEGVKPDQVTFMLMLDACASETALAQGKQLHERMRACGFELDTAVANTLLSMYGKCGSLDSAAETFQKMILKSVVSWTAMISSYAQHGRFAEALALLPQMQQQGIQPNSITYLGVLSACSHAGLVMEACAHLASMRTDYDGIVPEAGHYVCMAELLSRAGWLAEAEELINRMPFDPGASAWMTLLGGCSVHSDVSRGAYAAERAASASELNNSQSQDAAPYVLLSNVCAAASSWWLS